MEENKNSYSTEEWSTYSIIRDFRENRELIYSRNKKLYCDTLINLGSGGFSLVQNKMYDVFGQEMAEATFESFKQCNNADKAYFSGQFDGIWGCIYLPKEKMKYAMKMNCDDRGSFTELIHITDCGQVSINISKPGITKGQHWHNSKWEQFIVVHGHGLIQERNINTGEMVEFEVSGDKIEAIYMIPGWTHNIINLSETEDLVTVMTCNEIFNPSHPDTFFEKV